MLPRNSQGGIYAIRNTKSNCVYVGATTSIRQRWHEHRARLHFQKHPNKRLQQDWDEFGGDVFVFEVLELVIDRQSLGAREVYWMETERQHNSLYNSTRAALGLNYKHRLGTIAKNSIAPVTIRLSDDDKALIEIVKQRYGLASTIQAIRLALRMLVERSQ